ncbi:L,D-transpeptidase [Paenibacillus typhae]|uniref:Lipoprotein-anchoring transpeptidase ErfK/SrfK n=1 Tax=Paenibacillus typhae TaxID=1174501 RepID=A0A1G8F2N4_9BACL|nr:L,D-transpeptidase [Paenibacillus typhae]SDH76269.1 Lipoprotein-anchoring transpeptidase ErfK/SrfK [Paenibacillus typhae]
MKNSQHLKAYVQMHPDNKMAWYLLGKEYYKNGQQGKANYCFNQAGEVYEAFERSKVPADMLREYEDGLLKVEHERHQAGLRKRRLLVALALTLLVFLPSAVPAGTDAGSGAALASLLSEAADASVEPAADKTGAEQVNAPEEPEPGLAFTAMGSDAAASGAAIAQLLRDGARSATAILAMERSGKWLLWKEKLPLAATVVQSGKGRAVYQSYDKAGCRCEPPEAGALQQQAGQWQRQQEQLAVLWSAMLAYRSSEGSLPPSLAALTGAFPGNWLGGTTPLMKEKFASVRNVAAAGAAQQPAADPGGKETASGSGEAAGGNAAAAGSGGQELPFFTGPLTIIVDKQNHRLAVTSGSVIIRNYKVGLGGARTPEGTFTITDKVVNPNGRDNGEFGSRGMQLSDSNYAIHGTDEPESIGKDESLGCIRMSREDVEELFAMVPMGTKVQISKGGLPEELLVPADRYPSEAPGNQTNPNKVYHWLN